MTTVTRDPRHTRLNRVASDCADELQRRNGAGREPWTAPPAPTAGRVIVIREIDLAHEAAADGASPALGPRSAFSLHREITAVLGRSDASDCSVCRAIDILVDRSRTRRDGPAPMAVLSPCGWVSLVEDAEICVVSTVSLDLKILLADDPPPDGSRD